MFTEGLVCLQNRFFHLRRHEQTFHVLPDLPRDILQGFQVSRIRGRKHRVDFLGGPGVFQENLVGVS